MSRLVADTSRSAWTGVHAVAGDGDGYPDGLRVARRGGQRERVLSAAGDLAADVLQVAGAVRAGGRGGAGRPLSAAAAVSARDRCAGRGGDRAAAQTAGRQ